MRQVILNDTTPNHEFPLYRISYQSLFDRELLCAETSSSIGVCDYSWFWMLFRSEYDRLVVLIKARHQEWDLEWLCCGKCRGRYSGRVSKEGISGRQSCQLLRERYENAMRENEVTVVLKSVVYGAKLSGSLHIKNI